MVSNKKMTAKDLLIYLYTKLRKKKKEKIMDKNICNIRITSKKDEKLVGRAFVPCQDFADIYDPMMGLDSGTVFAELDMPYPPKTMAGYR